MNDGTEASGLIRRYLLHQTSDSEQESVEARLFADPVFLEQVEGMEHELVVEYLASRGDAAVEQFATAPERQLLLQLHQALRRRFTTRTSGGQPTPLSASAAEPPASTKGPRSWGAFLPIAATLLVAAGAALYTSAELARVRLQLSAIEDRVRQLPANPPAPSAVFSLAIAPAAVLRGGTPAPETLALPDGGVEIQFLLPPGTSPGRYFVQIDRPDGTQLWGRLLDTNDALAVTAFLTPGLLPPDDYIATIADATNTVIARYRFRVTAR